MHPASPIDLALLRRLYVEDALTAQEVAIRLGCGASTVFRRLRALGIPARGRGPRTPGNVAAFVPAWNAATA